MVPALPASSARAGSGAGNTVPPYEADVRVSRATLFPEADMTMTASDVIKLIKEKEVKYADLRFTDTRGKEQHVTIPANLVDDELFRDGKTFDGSSLAGWKGINESDMILMLDPGTAVIDPFFEETTVDIRCDV